MIPTPTEAPTLLLRATTILLIHVLTLGPGASAGAPPEADPQASEARSVPNADDCEELNRELPAKLVKIELRDGRVFENAKKVRRQDQTLSWSSQGAQHEQPMQEVLRLWARGRAKGSKIAAGSLWLASGITSGQILGVAALAVLLAGQRLSKRRSRLLCEVSPAGEETKLEESVSVQ